MNLKPKTSILKLEFWNSVYFVEFIYIFIFMVQFIHSKNVIYFKTNKTWMNSLEKFYIDHYQLYYATFKPCVYIINL